MAIQQLGQKVWYDEAVMGYVMLDITGDIKPPKKMEIDGQNLLPKSEYHCSLVAARKLANEKVSEAQIIGIVRNFLATHTIRFISLTDERFVCRKRGEITVISGAKVIGLEELRAELQQLIPTYVSLFPHVTLLKSENSPYGIGIDSQLDFEYLCQKM